jgi:hypothetical protein
MKALARLCFCGSMLFYVVALTCRGNYDLQALALLGVFMSFVFGLGVLIAGDKK